MYIEKTKQKNGKTYAIVKGLKKDTLLKDISKKYSKNWKLTAFTNPDTKKGLLLIKRKKPLNKIIETYQEWERS